MSVEGFEDYTYEVTEFEKSLMPDIVKAFRKNHVGKKRAITSRQIKDAYKKRNIKMDGPRWRKIIGYMIVNGHFKDEILVADSTGYYLANDSDSIIQHMKSLKSRSNAILRRLDQTEFQFRKSKLFKPFKF